MIRPDVVLRAMRFLILLGAVVVAAMFFRSCEKLTIPAQDQSMDPTYPGGTTVFVEDLSEKDIAERLGLSRDGVAGQLKRIRKAIRKALEDPE